MPIDLQASQVPGTPPSHSSLLSSKYMVKMCLRIIT
ncbi:hypothetical protein Pint_05926 [Pistacia integerrima]|uniref:Uncharacterized protein n=1 Tax=Pistacia integerrima TaxID=434235 RepID=A0ACC0Z5M0_9ROSI|nr:hypothetical protein Pint_05926 [Pistacia integerrima]